MGLNVGNAQVKQVYVGSTPVREVYVGAKKVWPDGPRTVALTANFENFVPSSATGDVDMIASWPKTFIGQQGVAFQTAVTCDRQVTAPGGVPVGQVISAGTAIYAPGNTGPSALFQFTEVL